MPPAIINAEKIIVVTTIQIRNRVCPLSLYFIKLVLLKSIGFILYYFLDLIFDSFVYKSK